MREKHLKLDKALEHVGVTAEQRYSNQKPILLEGWLNGIEFPY
jgi:hypothetical protein